MSDERKRPRDEEFQPEVKRTTQTKEEPDAFEKNKPKPLVVLAIIAVGILFAVGAMAVYRIAEQKQHTIINVLPTDIADDKEKASTAASEASGDNSQTAESSQEGSVEEIDEQTIRLDDIVYQIKNGCAIVTHCDSQLDTIQIPSVVEDYPVTEVADSAFNGRRTIYYLSIPEGVTTIGAYALANIG